jgi:hypothetical protein
MGMPPPTPSAMPLLMAREHQWFVSIGARFFFADRLPPGPLWPALLSGWQARPGGNETWDLRGRQSLSAVALAWVRTQEPRPRALPNKRQGQLLFGAFWFWEVLGFVWGRAKISAKKYVLFIMSYREWVVIGVLQQDNKPFIDNYWGVIASHPNLVSVDLDYIYIDKSVSELSAVVVTTAKGVVFGGAFAIDHTVFPKRAVRGGCQQV